MSLQRLQLLELYSQPGHGSKVLKRRCSRIDRAGALTFSQAKPLTFTIAGSNWRTPESGCQEVSAPSGVWERSW
jgi:hypothetical protein